VTLRGVLGRVAYGAAFTVALPALLVVWARRVEPLVPLRVPASAWAGVLLAAAGALLTTAAMTALAVHGRGLPMNAYPPERLVTRGVYALVPHPIYLGACLVSAGVSILCGSAAGFWLVTPVLALGCAALVLGHEEPDLEKRFGRRASPLLVTVPSGDDAPRPVERGAVFVSVLLPWVALYEAFVFLGVPDDARAVYFRFEERLRVVPATEILYAATYLLVAVAPLVARTRTDLALLARRGRLAMLAVFPLYLALPLAAPPRPFAGGGALGRLLAFERAWDTPAAAFPSFHVIWAFLAAETWAARFPKARPAFRLLAAGIAASCVTTGMHAVLDVLAGLAVAFLVIRSDAVWELLRRGAERLANSWREVRVGRVRVINHGAYAALGSGAGIFLAGVLAGRGAVPAVLLTACCGLAGAALWAQLVEGSPLLLRPYGYYGGVLGVLAGAAASPVLGVSPLLVVGAFSVAAPLIQAGGRLRCLVQGCCHGREAPSSIGIRYTHPRSRVTRLAHLAGVPLHPTQLYSILWNLEVGLVLARLWSAGAAPHLVAGLYLVLNGVGRFVEESYRGEPQTPVVLGLRLYQWMAAAGVLSGIALSMLPGAPSAPAPDPSLAAALGGAAFGLVTGAALGVDFPESNRRFARLA
jgi:protein-S-isoprenylcysteine O-methyltransferase Ste14